MGDYLDSHTSCFQSIGPRLKRLIRRCRVPDCDCEDCIQEAWLALLNAHPDWTLDEPRTISWLGTVARNKARDFHRARIRHRVQQLDDLSPILASSSEETPPELDPNGRRHVLLLRLRDALNRLSELNRQILFQRASQGRTYREIGLPVGLKPAQVKEHYHRVVRQLNETLRANTQGCIDDCEGGGRQRFLLRTLFISRRSLGQMESLIDAILTCGSVNCENTVGIFKCIVFQWVMSQGPFGQRITIRCATRRQ